MTCNIYPTAATMLSFLHNYTILDVYLTTDFIQMITQLQNLQVISDMPATWNTLIMLIEICRLCNVNLPT